MRAALCLGRAWDERPYSKVRDVAVEMDLPASYTPQILTMLVKAGLAEARTGRHGGYRLTRPPEQISMLEIVEAAEGTVGVVRCVLWDGPCHPDHACAFHASWVTATESFRASLTATTLGEAVRTDRAIHPGGGPRRLAEPSRARGERGGR